MSNYNYADPEEFFRQGVERFVNRILEDEKLRRDERRADAFLAQRLREMQCQDTD